MLIKYFTVSTCELFAQVQLVPRNVRYNTSLHYFQWGMLITLCNLKFMVLLCY